MCLQVTSVPQDIQTKGETLNFGVYFNLKCVCTGPVERAPCISMATGGPLSVGKELAQLYNLEGVKEVIVRKVDKDEVGIDLLELKFKVQNELLSPDVTCCPILYLRVSRLSDCCLCILQRERASRYPFLCVHRHRSEYTCTRERTFGQNGQVHHFC